MPSRSHRAAGGPEIDVREFEARARSATRTRIGWPAPPDPADAIDDAEFDLATLAPLVKGSGEYLKSLPGRAVPRCVRAGCAGTNRGSRPTACSSKKSAAMRSSPTG